MDVSVVGPGALGCLFAARLSRAGIRTCLVDYKPERVKRLNSSGITIESSDGKFTEHVHCTVTFPKTTRLVIVLVKSYSTRALTKLPSCPILTLQNGLGNVETLCSLVGSHQVLAGATYEAAHCLSEGVVRHVASGLTRFGAWTSCETQIAEQVLRQADFSVEVTEAPGQTIWEKTIINAGINPLTAILNVCNGALLQIPEARQLMRDLVVEAVKVATSEGYRFPFSLIERTEEVCLATGKNISSMLQDMRAGKKTEIDAICGEILDRAQIAGLPAPRTRVVWQLIKALETK